MDRSIASQKILGSTSDGRNSLYMLCKSENETRDGYPFPISFSTDVKPRNCICSNTEPPSNESLSIFVFGLMQRIKFVPYGIYKMIKNERKSIKYEMKFDEKFYFTLHSSFLIRSQTCILNFEPTESKVNLLLNGVELLLPKIVFTSVLVEPFISDSNEACSASLFFSINWS